MKIQEIYAKKRTPFISRLNINARQLLNRRIDIFNQKVKQLNENPRNLCEKENTIHFAS